MARTALSISAEAWVAIIQLFMLLLITAILMKHFHKDKNNNNTLWMKLFSITPILLIIPLSMIGGFLFNDAVIPPINSYYPFINNHCHQLFIIIGSIWHFVRYSTWIFYLYRIKYYFQSSEKYQMSNRTFWAHTIFYTIATMASLYMTIKFNLSQPSSSVSTIINASDNSNYRFCYVSFATGTEFDIIRILTFIVNEGWVSLYLLYILYSRTTNLEKDQKENQSLSVHFSQRDTKNVINTTIMRRCLFFGILSLMVHWLSIIWVLVISADKYVFDACVIFNCISILVSFDIRYCDCIGNDQDEDGDVNQVQHQQVELTQDQNQYLTQVMAVYYAVPTRRHRIPPSVVISNSN